MSLLNRLARRILRAELDELDSRLESYRRQVLLERAKANAYWSTLDNLQRAVAAMEPWARENAAGDIRLLAWAQLLKYTPHNGSWTDTNCVHPFDRWGINPKP
jgi:hypothetical protein